MSSPSEDKPKPRRRLRKWTLGLVAGLIILAAAGVGLFRVAVNLLPRYHDTIEAQASAQLGAPVRFGRLSLSWHLFGPELTASNVRILSAKTGRPVMRMRRLRLDFAITAVFHGTKARPSAIHVVGPELELVRRPGGGLAIPGFRLPKSAAGQKPGAILGDAFSITQGTVRLHLQGKPAPTWTVTPVNVHIGGGRRHSVRLSLGLPAQLGGGTLRATGSIRTPGMDPAQWNWSVHAALDRVQLGPLARVLPGSFPPMRGVVAFDGGAQGKGPALAAGSGRLSAKRLASGPSRVLALQTRFAVAGGAGFQVTLTGTRIAESHRVWKPGTITVTRSQDGRWQAGIASVELAALPPLVGFLPARAAVAGKRLRDVQPRGTVKNLQAAFTPGKRNVGLKAVLDDVSVQAADNAPGFEHLAATVDIRDGAGTIRMNSPKFTLLMPHLFGHPVTLDRVSGTLAVAVADTGLRLATPGMAIKAPGLSGGLKGEISVPSGGPVHIKLAARADGTDLVEARKHYLPQGLLPPQLDKWLMQGLAKGRLTGATLDLDGDARKFPYEHGGGEFHARFGFAGVALTPGRGWMPLQDLKGTVSFDNASMQAKIDGGEIAGAHVTNATTSIADLFKLHLLVHAQVVGDAHNFLDFLRASPVGEKLANGFSGFHASGPARTDLTLRLPIMHPNRFTLDGTLHVKGATATYKGVPFNVTRLTGATRFDGKGPTGGALSGSALGTPVKIRLARDPRSGAAEVRIDGAFPVNRIDQALHAKLGKYVDGNLPLQVDMSISMARHGVPFRIDAYSDLRGTAIDLPAPLGKPAASRVPMAAQVTVRGRSVEVSARYADQLRSCAHIEAGGTQPVVHGLALFLGSGACHVPERGILVGGGWPSIDIQSWLAKLPGGQGGPAGAEKLGPLTLDLHFGQISGYAQTFHDEKITGTLTPSDMLVGFDGPELAGKLDMPRKPTNDSPVVVELTRGRFVLPRKSGVVVSPAQGTAPAPASAAKAAAAGSASVPAPATAVAGALASHSTSAPAEASAAAASSVTPRKIPPFVVHAAHLELGSAALDDVLVRGRRVPNGIVVDPIHVGGGALKLDGTLAWIKTPNGGSQGSLRFTGNVDGLGKLLDGLGVGEVITGHGALSAALAWNEPQQAGNFTKDLLGRVSVDLRDGGIAQVNPGAGRLLSLLAVVNIPRYLVFNFHNLFGKGFPFSRIYGDYVINKGIAKTKGLHINSSIANIKLVGQVDLDKQTIDQEADIVPNYTGSLPIIGALFGGLPVAAAIFAVTKIFGGPIAQASTMKYSVKGPLQNPVVKPLGHAPPPKAGTRPAPAAATSGGRP